MMTKELELIHFFLCLSFIQLFGITPIHAEYRQTTSQPLEPGAVAVTEPGSYATPGTTYQLMQDIKSATSALFLGKDVRLDLNGYTISFADAAYEHIPNYGFEDGLKHWDISNAPEAKIEDTERVWIFIGKKLLRLHQGEEIISEFITLPVANRSYFAMCGVTSRDMKISLFVEDESGNNIQCFSTVDDTTRQCCPILNRSPRLGGGFVTAHVHGQPSGRYRVRVCAETDCLVDHIDLRPAMDVGIGIVEKILPFAHNDDLYRGEFCAFFDISTLDGSHRPIKGIPVVSGSGKIVIKNGIIKCDTRGVLSWGIQSTAPDVRIILDNVKIVSAGINTNAVDVPQATLSNCRFEIDTPFIINRHVSEHAVVLRGPQPSAVSFCHFYGGQGCLTIMGENSNVHDNLFVNRQTVTNHYCVMAMGDGSRIHHNLFKPEIGSGVEIYRHKDIQIHDNEFHIEAAPPTCEYGHEEYSTTAIRVADYGAEPGSPRACAENRIFQNTFHITGKDYPQYPDYIPMAWAFFHSVSGGDTYIYDNDIYVFHQDPGSKAEAAAIYIGGAQNGGVWENNRITSNVAAAWIASRYGSAAKAKFINNTIKRSTEAPADFIPFRMGWHGREGVVASDIEFNSNVFHDCKFTIDATDENHTFSVSWTLTVHVLDHHDRVVPGVTVTIHDVDGELCFNEKTDEDGKIVCELQEYRFSNGKRSEALPFTISVGKESKHVFLKSNQEIYIQLP